MSQPAHIILDLIKLLGMAILLQTILKVKCICVVVVSWKNKTRDSDT